MFLTPATIEISQVTAEQAKGLLDGKEVINAIGHKATADVLNMLLGTSYDVNRIQIKMTSKDEALVFGLQKRLEEGRILRTVEEINEIGYALYYLKVI